MKVDNIVDEYWQGAYHEDDPKPATSGKQLSNLQRRQIRNRAMAHDFLIHVQGRPRPIMLEKLSQMRTALEVGCGTGEFLHTLINATPIEYGLGVDLSHKAVTTAAALLLPPAGKILEWAVGDMMKMDGSGGDLIIANQVVEHFRDPVEVVNHLRQLGKFLLVLTPYKEAVPPPRDDQLDGSDTHMLSIDESTYEGMPVIDDLVFFSLEGWGASRQGECPLQYAVLIEGDTQ